MNLDTPRRYALRAILALLLIAALLDLRPAPGRGEVLPIALVDVSRSVGRMPQALPEGVRTEPDWVVFADGVEELVGGAEAPTIGRSRSRLAAALRHVATTRPGRDVVVVTDGRSTDGDPAAAARALRAAGGRVFTLAPETPRAEVGLEEARLVAGWPAPRVRARIVASTSGQAEVRLVQGTRVADRRTVALVPGGRETIELQDPTPDAEGGTYHVVLAALAGTPDDDAEDDRLAVGLRPVRRVVLFWGLPEARSFEAGRELVVRASRDPRPEDLEGADALVMANVPWRDLGADGARALERFVAGGGRLLLLGGPEAYAGGGWAGTRLEARLAPLRVPREDGTQLAIVFAVDVSGSTRGTRLAHLKEAIRRAVQGLVPGERIGVLPFRGAPDGALLGPGLVAADDSEARAALLASIDALEARGETDIPRAMAAARRFVEAVPARARRVILLSDGDPDRPPSPEALAREGATLRARGVGFGAFVVGDDEAVARLRTHVARDPDDVVSVRDVAQLPLRLLHALGSRRHDDALVTLRPGDDLAFALPGDPTLPEIALPPLSALHGLEIAADEGASALARVRRDGPGGFDLPLAAVREVGAGRVVALAWGPALERDRERRPRALAALRPWIEALAAASDRGLQADLDGQTLVVRWPAAAGTGRVLAAGATGVTSLIEAARGVFRGPLPPGAEAGVRVRTGSEGSPVRPLHLPSRPQPEFLGAGVDAAALEALAAAGGGRRLAPGERSPTGPPPRGVPLAPWLLLLASILLIIDRWGAKPDAPLADSTGGAVSGS